MKTQNLLPPLSGEFLSRLRESIKDPSQGYNTLGIVMHQLIDDLTGLRRQNAELKRQIKDAIAESERLDAETKRLKGGAS